MIFEGYVEDGYIIDASQRGKHEEERKVLPPPEIKITNLQLAWKFIKHREAQENKEAAEFLTEDCIVIPPFGSDIKGKGEIFKMFEKNKNDPRPDMK